MQMSKYSTRVNRFWKKVDKNGPIVRPELGPCWLWTRKLTKRKYGMVWWTDQRSQFAHRVSYQLHYGDIPVDLFVLHRCDTRHCVRPDHLFVGTKQDNASDMISKGRQLSGMKNHASKLTDSRVLDARKRYFSGNATLTVLAAENNVSGSTMYAALIGQNWRHLPKLLKSDIGKCIAPRFQGRISNYSLVASRVIANIRIRAVTPAK